MQKTELIAVLKEKLSELDGITAPIEDIKTDDLLVTLGIDSITFIRLVVMLEEVLNIVFDDEVLSIDRLGTLEDIAEYLQIKLRN